MYHAYYIYTYIYLSIYLSVYLSIYLSIYFCIYKIYIVFIRPQLDDGDIIFDQGYNKSFRENLESLQYKASLAMTRATRVTPKEKLYQELDLKSFQHRRWFGKLCTFCKIFKNQSPCYLYELLPLRTSHNARWSRNIPFFHFKHNFFKNSFFSFRKYWIEQSRQIYSKFRNIFTKGILKFKRPSPNSTCNCFNAKSIKHLTRLRLVKSSSLSQVQAHFFGFI